MSTSATPATPAEPWRVSPDWWAGFPLDGPRETRMVAARLRTEARYAIETATEIVDAARQTTARARACRREHH